MSFGGLGNPTPPTTEDSIELLYVASDAFFSVVPLIPFDWQLVARQRSNIRGRFVICVGDNPASFFILLCVVSRRFFFEMKEQSHSACNDYCFEHSDAYGKDSIETKYGVRWSGNKTRDTKATSLTST